MAGLVGVGSSRRGRNFLGAGDLEAVAAFDGLDEGTGPYKRFVGTGAQPGGAATDFIQAHVTGFQIALVQVEDFTLLARRGD